MLIQDITKDKTWIMYLRKSRQDDPRETVEEVLEKHETMLQEFAKTELGRAIPAEDIYREIVSGESIDERVEIKKVLARLEDPSVAGVLVVEPQRLSRGDLEDCGRLINSFRFTHSKVATPMMVYDLENKMERKFFQDELLRGRDYLEYTKEILYRGRVAAVKRGCYLGNYAPYGFKKIKKGKDHTLEIIPEEADVVRMVFDWYITEDLTPLRIADRLNEMGVEPSRGKKWNKESIRFMLRNEHYAGYVVFNKYKTTPVLENGEVVTKRLKQDEGEAIIAEGLHTAIISRETWEQAKALVARHPRAKHEHELKNPLAGILVCAKCGRALYQHPYKHAEDRYECRTRPRCFMSTKISELDNAVLAALEHAELPALEAKVKNGDGQAVKIQQKAIKKLEAQMEEYLAQEDRQYEFLETGRYAQDIFDKRHTALRAKIEGCQSALYKARATMPKNVDYSERIVALKDAIAALKDPTLRPAEKNKLLRAIVERIEFTGAPPRSVDGVKIKGFKKGHNPFSIKVFLRI